MTTYADLSYTSLNTPPSVGPLISGLLLLRWSWRSIFWFLTTSSSVCLLFVLFLFPETARGIVGDGSQRALWPGRPLLSKFLPRTRAIRHLESSMQVAPRPAFNPLATVKLVRFPGTAMILIAYALGYAVYSCLQASLSALFTASYKISGLTSGLIYIPFGVACAISAYATGLLLDYNYGRTARSLGLVIDRKNADDLLKSPIELARLRTVLYLVLVSAVLVVAYGWQLHYAQDVTMAGLLVTQFFIGLTLQTMFTSLNSLLVDIHQDCPSTAQAACNLFRCELAAGLLAATDVMIRHIGVGWFFTSLGALLGLAVALLVPARRNGLKWRQTSAQSHAPSRAEDADVGWSCWRQSLRSVYATSASLPQRSHSRRLCNE